MRLLVKKLLIEVILRWKITMNQVKNKKLGLRYFCRFVTRALTLRPRRRYIYVFRALFGFCSFQVTSYEFWKLGVSSLIFELNFDETERNFWGLNILFYCCTRHQYSEFTHISFFVLFCFVFFEVSN